MRVFVSTIMWVVLALQLGVVRAAEAPAATPALEAGLVNPGAHDKPDWFKDSFLDLRDDIAEATAANKRVLLYFYQDGCPYCAKLLKTGFFDPVLGAKTREYFDVIALNMWGDREVTDSQGNTLTEKAFAASLRVQYTPTLLFLNESAGVALRVNGYYAPDKLEAALDYVHGKHEAQGKFAAFYAARQAAAAAGLNTSATSTASKHLIADSLPSPLKLADARKASGRGLLVITGQQNCADCAELYTDILARKEVAYSLSNLDVAQLDLDAPATLLQTPDGRETSVGAWAQELDIKYSPSLLFFDADGKEVFRTEAYFKAFHIHGALDYVVSGAYRHQPEFQRFLQHRREVLAARGFVVDLMD